MPASTGTRGAAEPSKDSRHLHAFQDMPRSIHSLNIPNHHPRPEKLASHETVADIHITKQFWLLEIPDLSRYYRFKTAYCILSECCLSYLRVSFSHSIAMPKVKGTNDVSLESPASGSKESLSSHGGRYTKVYRFFGFTRGYNFPLCEY
jgi:hypothetical protein